ncbi:MAG: hypothetical protein Ct9H90mP25_0590 [Gammaproteobacteria bacterium]|nr:MAG: hypothetical protein Ct9H90mP25_0590 [Gammaproteobacteria bacterium]
MSEPFWARGGAFCQDAGFQSKIELEGEIKGYSILGRGVQLENRSLKGQLMKKGRIAFLFFFFKLAFCNPGPPHSTEGPGFKERLNKALEK